MTEPELSPKIIKLIEQYKLEVKSCPDCDRHFIAMFEDFDSIECLSNWEMANVAKPQINCRNYVVTHFAIIDAVESSQNEINQED